jgi:hypothetical protein
MRFALLALAIQFALSFRHVHLRGGQRSTAAPFVLQWIVQAATAAPQAPADPTQDKAGLAGDFCAICSAVQTAGSGVPPATPVLPLSDGHSGIALGASVDFTGAASPHLPFQARAPPHA